MWGAWICTRAARNLVQSFAVLALVPSGDSARSLIRTLEELVTSNDNEELPSSRCPVKGAHEVRVDEMDEINEMDEKDDGGGGEAEKEDHDDRVVSREIARCN
jgi:hypothetical protein